MDQSTNIFSKLKKLTKTNIFVVAAVKYYKILMDKFPYSGTKG